MGKEYGHIVYTRRRNGIELDGSVAREGLGVHQLSSNVLEGDIDKDFLDTTLNMGRLPPMDEQTTMYMYVVPIIGAPMFGRYRNRNKAECDAAYAAGVDNRISQICEWLTGDFIKYPFEYIDSPFFAADKKSMAEYYGDNPTPIVPPLPAESVAVGPMTRGDVMAFAADGRANAIRAAVCALISQFERPEHERKFIVIYDTELNVRKWIAAICYAFPLQAAKEIGFVTQMMNVENVTANSFYIYKTTGRYVKSRNMQDPNQERRCRTMLAGALPKPTETSVSKPMANAPYIVIDGINKTALFEESALSQRAYIKAVIDDDAAIQDFCNHMGEMTDIRISSRLCDLFDALNAIKEPDNWKYDSLLSALNLLSPIFTQKSVLMRFVIDKLCVQGEYFKRFTAEDERNNLQLFGALRKITIKFSLNDAGQALCDIADKRITKLLGESANVNALKMYLNTLKQLDEALLRELIVKQIVDKKLSAIDSSAITEGSDSYVTTLFSLIRDTMSTKPNGMYAFLTDQSLSAISDALIKKCASNTGLTKSALSILAGDMKSIENFIVRGSEQYSGNRLHWWRALLENGVPVGDLCRIMNNCGMSAPEIESVLCIEMRLRGYKEQLYNLYRTYLAKETGVEFMREWLRYTVRSANIARDSKRILTEIYSNPNLTGLLGEALKTLDKLVEFEQSNENEELVSVIRGFADRARIDCPKTLLWGYLNAMINAKIPRKDKNGIAGAYITANANGRRYQAPKNLIKLTMGKSFCDKVIEYSEEPAGQLVALMSFTFESPASNIDYIESYAEVICSGSIKHKDQGLASAIYLRECAATGMPTRDAADQILQLFDSNTLLSQLNIFIDKLYDCMCGMRTDKVSAQLVSSCEAIYGKSVAEKLEYAFKKAQEEYSRNHKGGFFENLFKAIDRNKQKK